ncbi:ATP-dependent DNA helicase RecG [Melaminivora sp.]
MPRAVAPAPSAQTTVKTAAASPARRALLKLGLERDIDLALHLPLRYEDETRITPIASARDGAQVQIEGQVIASQVQLQPRRQLLVTLQDASGSCELRFFSFYPSHQKTMAVGARLRARGELRGGFWGRQMLHPVVRSATAELPSALTPVYPSVAQLPQAYLRRAIVTALARVPLPETLPAGLPPPPSAIHKENPGMSAWSLREALLFLHHPTPDVALATLEDRSHPAWQRLKAEELLAQQLSQHAARRARAQHSAPRLQADGAQSLPEQLRAALPFALTAAQQRVVAEIARDLARSRPMHRLLQGDVGSGKTVVAALAACICIQAGWQCALMAPTEILAEQHFAKLIGWLQPLLAARGQGVAWLAGGQKKRQRAAMLAAIEEGTAALVVGTHAVIQEQVRFARLGLGVIDEQHRFGVAQRLALRKKLAQQGQEPHVLMMSATPIPRTLAMSYYADLDVSTIDELPPGRTPIVTRLIPDSRRDELIARIAAQVAAGRQAYWVCPLIEESEALDLTNATAVHVELSEALAPAPVGLLHSRLPAAEKRAVMEQFQSGQMALLVATTVIEVGVDVPNASLMVIEHAERFGLSQLHQLRGRVGRGAAASACVLLYSTGDSGRLGETARERLKAMQETGDGFEIARRDLDIRGPGEFLGARQSGDALLRFADLTSDSALLDWARQVAPLMLEQYPALAAQHVERWLGGKSDFLKA